MVPPAKCLTLPPLYKRQDDQAVEGLRKVPQSGCREQLIARSHTSRCRGRWCTTSESSLFSRCFLSQTSSHDTPRYRCRSRSSSNVCECARLPHQQYFCEQRWRDLHQQRRPPDQPLEPQHSGSELQHCRHQARQHGRVDRSHHGCRVPPTELQLVYVCEFERHNQTCRYARKCALRSTCKAYVLYNFVASLLTYLQNSSRKRTHHHAHSSPRSSPPFLMSASPTMVATFSRVTTLQSRFGM